MPLLQKGEQGFMKTVKFSYANTTQDLQVPDDTPVLTSKVGQLTSDRTGLDIVREAMENPIDSPRLSELAKGKDNCVIIISDHTRPVPSKDILPNMIRELREGSPDIKIKLLVATGFHRPTSIEELKNKLGDALYEEFKDDIVVHDAHDPSRNVKVGSLPSGPDCIIDKLAMETQLLVAEGFIEPHFFAGFSGGRKSILPGIADAVTVMGNHCSKFVDSPYSRPGILDHNPIHEDMLAAARMAKLAYIVNVVIDGSQKPVAAFAGNFETAHRRGCDFISDYVCVKPAYADIVITTNGGYPLDQNAYQSPKGIPAKRARRTVRSLSCWLPAWTEQVVITSITLSRMSPISRLLIRNSLRRPRKRPLPTSGAARFWPVLSVNTRSFSSLMKTRRI